MKKKKNKAYEMPPPPKNDEQLIHQMKMIQSFISIAISTTKSGRFVTAYDMMMRSIDLMNQNLKAMEDVPPSKKHKGGDVSI